MCRNGVGKTLYVVVIALNTVQLFRLCESVTVCWRLLRSIADIRRHNRYYATLLGFVGLIYIGGHVGTPPKEASFRFRGV